MVKKTEIIYIVILCILAFSSGFLLNSGNRNSTSNDMLQLSELQSESFALEQALIVSYTPDSCAFLEQRQSALIDELATTGKKLVTEDTQKSLSATSYDILKKKYHLLQIRAYIQQFQLDENCKRTKNTILYYYDKSNDSKKQGELLDSIVGKLGDKNISVFAIERNYAPELEFMERYYNISQSPTIIINYKITKIGLTSEENILDAIWNKS